MATKVILCCIRQNPEFQGHLQDDHLVFLFEKYGEVKSVQIFDRQTILKSFIEFIDAKSAQRALNSFTDHVTSFGRLKVYSSKKKFIITSIQQRPFIKALENMPLTDILTPFKHQGDYAMSHSSQITPLIVPWMKDLLISKPENKDNEPDQIRQFLSVDNNLIDRLQNKPINNHKELPNSICNINQVSMLNETEQEFTVLRIDGVNTEVISSHFLINLFGYFGEIRRVILDKNHGYAFIEFRGIKRAMLAIGMLRGREFFGKVFKFSVSKQSQIDFETFWKRPLAGQIKACELSVVANKTGSNPDLGVATIPTVLLRVSKVPVALNSVLLHNLLSVVNRPISVFMEKGLKEEGMSYEVKFRKIQQAIEVLACFQRQKIDTGVIRIDFLNYSSL